MSMIKKNPALVVLILLLFLLWLSACEDEETGGISVVTTTPTPAAAQAVAFETIDRDMDEDEIQGSLIITQAADESKVTEYRLYWGSSATTKLAGQTMIASFTAAGTSHTHDFAEDTAIPAGATHLLVFSVNGKTEATTPTAYDIPDGVIELVKNFDASSGDSMPGSDPSYFPYFIGTNDTIYFFVDAGASDFRLWKSDGTTSTEIKDVDVNPHKMAVMGDTLFFNAYDSTWQSQLWKTNGTSVSRITGVNDSGDSYPERLTVMGTNLFFKANDDGAIPTLFKTDGSTGTAVSVCSPESMLAVGSTLYFNAFVDSTIGVELWTSNGSSAAYLENINTTSFQDSFIGNLTEFDGKLFFSASDMSGSNNKELWKSDGSTTTKVKEINPTEGSKPSNLKVFNGSLYFSARSDSSYREIWKSDGSSTGTQLVKTICDTSCSETDPQNFTVAGNKLFFAADDSSNNVELWVTDGTTANTYKVREIFESGTSAVQNLTSVGDYIFFTANDGPSNHGEELWFSDGTATGTFMLIDLYPGINPGFTNSRLYSLGNTVFMSATNGISGRELWRYYTK